MIQNKIPAFVHDNSIIIYVGDISGILMPDCTVHSTKCTGDNK